MRRRRRRRQRKYEAMRLQECTGSDLQYICSSARLYLATRVTRARVNNCDNLQQKAGCGCAQDAADYGNISLQARHVT